jgi:hypothetical protein
MMTLRLSSAARRGIEAGKGVAHADPAQLFEGMSTSW